MVNKLFCRENIKLKEEFIDVQGGVRLRVLDFIPENDTNEKPMVVFVSGWISLVRGWEGLLSSLTEKYRTLYVETREKKSAILPDKRQHDFSIERMSLDLREVISKKVEKERPFYFCGSSLGSTVILDYMSSNFRNPVQAMVISPICEFPFPFWLRFVIKFVPAGLYSCVRPILKWYLRNIKLDKKNEPEQVEKYEGTIDAAEPSRLKANAYAIKDYSLWEKLKKIGSPVVLIGAKTDRLHGIEILNRMKAEMPGARIEIMQSNKETHSEKAGMLVVDIIQGKQG